MGFEIIVSPEAKEDIDRLTARHRSTILDAIELHLRHEPAKISRSRIRRLRGLSKPQYRLRIGEFRVLCDVEEDIVQILAVVAKSDAADWLDQLGEAE